MTVDIVEARVGGSSGLYTTTGVRSIEMDPSVSLQELSLKSLEAEMTSTSLELKDADDDQDLEVVLISQAQPGNPPC